MSGSAVVIGSVHMDLIARAAAFPALGESVSGGTFTMTPGGKGGNQAAQLALNGVATSVVTRVGDDAFGRSLLASLDSKGVDTRFAAIDHEHATGASVVLAGAGDYASIIAPGAAAALSRRDLEAAREAISAAEAVLIQWELPTPIVAESIAFCAELGARIVFNASPAAERTAVIAPDLWKAVDWLVVNRHEAFALLGQTSNRAMPVAELAQRVRFALGPANILITLGAEGSYWLGAQQEAFQQALPADVVDTVGAGDAFLGTFIAAVIDGASVPEALRRGAAAGALAVGKSGAFDALPTRAEIDIRLSLAGDR